MGKRVLVSWIGHTDLRAMARDCSALASEQIAEIGGWKERETGVGPVRALLDGETFDEVLLLGDYSSEVLARFAQWVRCNPNTHQISLANPSSHAEILAAVQPLLSELQIGKDDELCFHLSPGTPAMASIWILLGKSQFPATLFQTYDSRISIADIPFDITVDVLPQLLREPDRFWQHLQTQTPQEIGGFEKIIGTSPALRVAVGRAQRAAIHDVPVLILGESGTGKEMFADAFTGRVDVAGRICVRLTAPPFRAS